MSMPRRSNIQDEMPTPAVNAPAYLASGDSIGFVKNVEGDYFQVAVRDGEDFWLSRSHIKKAAGDRVDLDIRRKELDEHRLADPGIEPGRDPDQASIRDGMLSDEQQLQQREQMENELREQRGALDSGLDEK